MIKKYSTFMIFILTAALLFLYLPSCSKDDNPVSPDNGDGNDNDGSTTISYYIKGTIGGASGIGFVKEPGSVGGWGVITTNFTHLLASSTYPNPPTWMISFKGKTTGIYQNTNFITNDPNSIYASVEYFPNPADISEEYWSGTNVTITVTKYGGVNGTIEGTFFGSVSLFTDKGATPKAGPFPLTGGSFKIKRTQ